MNTTAWQRSPATVPVTGVGFGENQTGMGIGKKRSGSFSVNYYLDGADPIGNTIPNAFIEVVPGNALIQCMCAGDQGGPLFYKGKIAGLASFRFVATCDEQGPGYYLSLHRLTAWLHDTLIEMDPSVLADYDRNGTAGPEDYNLWKANFGSMSSLAADGNGNGVVDTADYVVWRHNVGPFLGAASSAAATQPTDSPIAAPEPTSLTVLLTTAVAFVSIIVPARSAPLLNVRI
jgi:hypothetical protein